MTHEIIEKRQICTEPTIQIYRRGTIYFNKAAHNLVRGWSAVLISFDPETRMMRMTRDVSLPAERAAHARAITKAGNTVSLSVKRLLTEYGVAQQHYVKMVDSGPNFLEFGPLKMEEDDAV